MGATASGEPFHTAYGSFVLDSGPSRATPIDAARPPNRELHGREQANCCGQSRCSASALAMVYIGTIALSGSGLEGPGASRHRFPLYGVSAKIRRPPRAQFNAFAIEIEILILRHPHMACATAETSESWGKNPRSLSLFRMFSNCA